MGCSHVMSHVTCMQGLGDDYQETISVSFFDLLEDVSVQLQLILVLKHAFLLGFFALSI